MNFSIIIALIVSILPFGYAATKNALRVIKPNCGPDDMIMSDCNFCTCTITGLLKCRPSRNRCTQEESMAEIKERLGENCEPGEIQNWECNRCLCIRPGKVECSEKRCDPIKEEPFDDSDLINRLYDMKKIIRDVGEIVKTNCQTCYRSGALVSCTEYKENCKPKPGLIIKLKKMNEGRKKQITAQCLPEDRITVACNECFCTSSSGTNHPNVNSSGIMCTTKKCKPGNDLPVPDTSEEDDDDQNQDDEGDEDQDKEQGPDEKQDADNEPDDSEEKQSHISNKTPNEGNDKCDVQGVLKSYLQIRGRANTCKAKETLESNCHICECVHAGVVKCTLRGHPDDFDVKSNIEQLKAETLPASSSYSNRAFAEKLKHGIPRCQTRGQVIRIDCNNCICENSWMMLCTQKRCANMRSSYKRNRHRKDNSMWSSEYVPFYDYDLIDM